MPGTMMASKVMLFCFTSWNSFSDRRMANEQEERKIIPKINEQMYRIAV
jgi:hypothetical protein